MTLQNKLKLSVCSATLLATIYSVPAFSDNKTDCQCGSIGNRVWFDADKDGIQDIIEPGVAGVNLTLTSCDASAPLTKTVTTDSNGYFWFYGLTSGSYKITATSPANRAFTQAMQGSNSAKDSDVYSNGQTSCITLNANEVNNDTDIGLVDPNSALSQLGGTVFADADSNGSQGSGEPGVPNATITLHDGWSNVIATTLSDNNGYYSFGDLAPQQGDSAYGCYSIKVTRPGSGTYMNSTPTTQDLHWVCTSSGEHNTGLNFGLSSPVTPPPNNNTASIGDIAFNDINANGVQDNGEGGVAGVQLFLYNGTGSTYLGQNTQTDANGMYSFTGLPAGCYTIGAYKPASGTFASGVFTTSTWRTNSCVAEGQSLTTVDFGIRDPNGGPVTPPPSGNVTIGDMVFNDTNNNGVQDNGEGGFSGIRVVLFDSAGNYVTESTTGSDGRYSFGNLAQGCYSVGIYGSTDLSYTNGTWRSNICASNSNIDFGVRDPGGNPPSGSTISIGNNVFRDINGNSVQDNGEPGYAGIRVILEDMSGNYISEMTTGNDGFFQFNNLTDNMCYRVRVEGPAGVTYVNGQTMSNICSTSMDIDFAVQPPAQPEPSDPSTIGGYSFHDANGDGILNPGETGFSGINVSLINELTGAVVQSLTTDANGQYNFTNVVDGCYLVRVELPDGGVYTYNTTSGVTDTQVCVQDGQVVTNNIGFVQSLGQCDHTIDVRKNDIEGWQKITYFYGFAPGGYRAPGDGGVHYGLQFIDLDLMPVLKDSNINLIGYDDAHLQNLVEEHFLVPVVRDSGHQKLFTKRHHYVDRFFFTVYYKLQDQHSPLDKQGRLDALDAMTDETIHLGLILQDQTDNSIRTEYFCFRNLDSNLSYGSTPIALDLNGDGKIGVTGDSTGLDHNKLGKTVLFDMLGNGQKIEMEWFAGDGDGILIDNRDGLAASQMNGTRLFGDQGGKFAHGYEQLARLDANRDGQLSGAELDGLALWVDNGDAVVQRGEIQNLVSYDIASISTQMTWTEGLMRSVATTSTGHTILSEDVWFQFAAPVPVATPVSQPALQLVRQPTLWLMGGLMMALLGTVAWRTRKSGVRA